jgi:hypothetical protein
VHNDDGLPTDPELAHRARSFQNGQDRQKAIELLQGLDDNARIIILADRCLCDDPKCQVKERKDGVAWGAYSTRMATWQMRGMLSEALASLE